MNDLLERELEEYKRNLRRGFKIIAEGRVPTNEDLIKEASVDAAHILAEKGIEVSDPDEVLRIGTERLTKRVISLGIKAMNSAIRDVIGASGVVGTAAVALLMAKAGTNTKTSGLKKMLDLIRERGGRVSSEELVEYIVSAGFEISRELAEVKYFREIENLLRERKLEDRVNDILPPIYEPFGRIVGGGRLTGKFVVGEIIAFGGAIGLSELLEIIEEWSEGKKFSSLIKSLELATPPIIYVLGEIEEAGDRTALSVPFASAYLAYIKGN
ncbi:MAG: hypothetical protein DRO00_01495 [Thermoproteota archaeon]|nr:MAG: hypothetical protein DRO00_01495 [Candidatus Korarchaeota archaeon]